MYLELDRLISYLIWHEIIFVTFRHGKTNIFNGVQRSMEESTLSILIGRSFGFLISLSTTGMNFLQKCSKVYSSLDISCWKYLTE